MIIKPILNCPTWDATSVSCCSRPDFSPEHFSVCL